MLIVIEGDNGTGKDTLAKRLDEYLKASGRDSCIITYEVEAKNMEREAKKEKNGLKKTEAFFKYNEFCGGLTKIKKYEISLLIRYWPSTMAASYADDVFSVDEVERTIKTYNVEKMPTPDFVFCLACDFEERKRRIYKRAMETDDDSDDISTARNKKYRVALQIIEKFVENWYNIDVTFKSETDVFNEVYNIFEKEMERYKLR